MDRTEETWFRTFVRCLLVGAVVAAVFAGLAQTIQDTRSDRLALAPDAQQRFQSQGG